MGSVMANVQNPTKEPIHFKSCVLFPPNPQAPLPTTRERPLGCKTVFVGGLVENISGTRNQFSEYLNFLLSLS